MSQPQTAWSRDSDQETSSRSSWPDLRIITQSEVIVHHSEEMKPLTSPDDTIESIVERNYSSNADTASNNTLESSFITCDQVQGQRRDSGKDAGGRRQLRSEMDAVRRPTELPLLETLIAPGQARIMLHQANVVEKTRSDQLTSPGFLSSARPSNQDARKSDKSHLTLLSRLPVMPSRAAAESTRQLGTGSRSSSSTLTSSSINHKKLSSCPSPRLSANIINSSNTLITRGGNISSANNHQEAGLDLPNFCSTCGQTVPGTNESVGKAESANNTPAKQANKDLSFDTHTTNLRVCRDPEALVKREQLTQVLAPPLNDNVLYHAFFLYNAKDSDWVKNVIEKLESATLGFKCCYFERDLASGLSQPQAILYGQKNALKTVVILSPEFSQSSWASCEGMLSDIDSGALRRDVVVVVVRPCETPQVLAGLPHIQTSKYGWWTQLLARLALPDESTVTEASMLSISSSLVGLHAGMQTMYLLLSIKSRSSCFGKEMVDPLQVPDELVSQGIQMPEEEYNETIRQLMADYKFRCHIWCYNMPLAVTAFTILLGLCLILTPVVEETYIRKGPETGLELVHGGIAWLSVLTLYMLATHIARRRMKSTTYKSLSKVNSVFIKYRVLVGVENLGLADCNKYYIHFFYYEIGPCLSHIQELIANQDEAASEAANHQCYNNTGNDSNNIAIDVIENGDCDGHAMSSDQILVLEDTHITNASVQIRAENLLLDNTGEYLNHLITKKLEKPNKHRHIKGYYCLCQFVEQRVFKLHV